MFASLTRKPPLRFSLPIASYSETTNQPLQSYRKPTTVHPTATAKLCHCFSTTVRRLYFPASPLLSSRLAAAPLAHPLSRSHPPPAAPSPTTTLLQSPFSLGVIDKNCAGSTLFSSACATA